MKMNELKPVCIWKEHYAKECIEIGGCRAVNTDVCYWVCLPLYHSTAIEENNPVKRQDRFKSAETII